jgi:Galactose oxidase, central domain
MQSRLARTASASSLFLVALFLVNCFRAPGTSAASSTGSLRETARMHAPRADHSSTPLPSGKVLIAGGFGGSGTESHPFSTAELYDPRSGSFEPQAA